MYFPIFGQSQPSTGRTSELRPARGLAVGFGGHASGFAGDLQATTAAGTFPDGTVTPIPVALTAGTGTGIGYVRFTMLTAQGQDSGLCPAGQPPTVSGCVFQDSTELSVYGGAAWNRYRSPLSGGDRYHARMARQFLLLSRPCCFRR